MSQSEENNNDISSLKLRKWVWHSQLHDMAPRSEGPTVADKPQEFIEKLISANKAALEKHKTRLGCKKKNSCVTGQDSDSEENTNIFVDNGRQYLDTMQKRPEGGHSY